MSGHKKTAKKKVDETPRQTEIPGTESIRLPSIDEAIDDLKIAEETRKLAAAEEEAAAAKLKNLMKKNADKFDKDANGCFEYPSGKAGFSVKYIPHAEDKIKVTQLKKESSKKK